MALDLPFLGLIAAAAVIEAVLFWLTSLMPLSAFFPGWGQSVEFVEMLGPDWLRNTFLQSAAFVILFLAFFAALWIVRRRKLSGFAHAAIFGAPISWAAVTSLMYPPYAVDLFHNLADSRMLWVYHANPMVTPPSARPFPILISFMRQPSAYGPLWYLLSFPGGLLAPHDLFLGVVLLKIWTALFYLASGVLIWLIVGRQRPRLALFAATLYLWNPFVIIRALADAHNDIFMFFFVLVAFYAATRHAWLLVFPALVLSVLVKYVSLLLAPLILVYVLMLPPTQRRLALPRLLVGGLTALMIAVALFIPFWDGSRTFSALRAEGSKSITSTPLLVQYFLTDHLFPGQGGDIARLWMRALFVVPYSWVALRLRPPITRLQGAAYQALWLYIVIAVAWFRPWYFLWVITIGCLLPSGWYLALTLTLSWFGMFPDIVEQYRMFIPWLANNPTPRIVAPVVVAYLVPALVWLAALIHSRSWHFPLVRSACSGVPGSELLP